LASLAQPSSRQPRRPSVLLPCLLREGARLKGAVRSAPFTVQKPSSVRSAPFTVQKPTSVRSGLYGRGNRIARPAALDGAAGWTTCATSERLARDEGSALLMPPSRANARGEFLRDAAAGRSRLLRVTQPCFTRRVLRSAAGRFPRLRAEPPNDRKGERCTDRLKVQERMEPRLW
jgi:hypothetical protein